MTDKAQQELLTTGLGAACVGLGAMFAVFPGFMNKQAGFGLPEDGSGNSVVRLVGVRDIAFGVGLLLNRQKEAEVQTWLNLLAVLGGGDILALGLALPKSKSKVRTLLGVSSSVAVTAAALYNAQARKS